ncbi:type II toxin-antitoxin system RelE family toxin [Prescottella subtropica]|uniref:type II toxin-antitoxin system RelE family toxin n=1 Tax=Prescottella subtropica TaxID=2545757 RepID=UPI0010F6A8AF|nr:type II toxin-antitoxin system RelE/ParE family toxin [Prescottella subtropica]
MARIELTDDAKDDLADLDKSAQKLVVKALRKLESEPSKRGQPLGSRASSDLTGFRKLVVGDRQCRIIYRVDADDTVVVIWVIAERADDKCYELAKSRLATWDNRPIAEEVTAMITDIWKS